MLISTRHAVDLAKLHQQLQLKVAMKNLASYSWDETSHKIVDEDNCIRLSLNLENLAALQPRDNQICFNTTTCQLVAVMERQSGIRFGGGSYEVCTIHPGY